MSKMNSKIANLLAYERQTIAMEHVSGLLTWDQETMMPSGSVEQRAELRGVMRGIVHSRRVSSEFSQLLEDAAASELDEFGSACVRKLKREHDYSASVPEGLVVAIEEACSRSSGIWENAKASNDVKAVLPVLGELVRLKREEASAIAVNGNAYDGLLDRFEPGTTTEWLDKLFDSLGSGLFDLRERIFASNRDVAVLNGHFPEDSQMGLSRDVATAFGYDWTRGRLDKSAHPFTSGGGNDVRITTRVSEVDPFSCLYATIHETGHGCYEQNIRQQYLLTPLGEGASFGVHESQSRLFENQLGRSSAFCSWLFGRMTSSFGTIGLEDADRFYSAVNQVSHGYIRTESDEVQYNLHIMLRYRLERDLINGEIEVDQLEEAWNQRFLADFGSEVDRPANGVLQDTHWFSGLFGYFPSYTIGNIYAAALHEAMLRDLPNLDKALGAGDPIPATDWLAEKVQQFGALHEPKDLIETAIGGSITEVPLLGYLERKFGELYDL